MPQMAGGATMTTPQMAGGATSDDALRAAGGLFGARGHMDRHAGGIVSLLKGKAWRPFSISEESTHRPATKTTVPPADTCAPMMRPDETHRVVFYFVKADPVHLTRMGIDRAKLPAPALWNELLREDLRRPLIWRVVQSRTRAS